MIKSLIYLFKRTVIEVLIIPYFIFDTITPDLTIFSPVRGFLASVFWKIGKKTRIRKGFRATRIGNIKIGKNCFINQNNLFNNESFIKVGDNCSFGFDNKFVTVNHIEKNKIRKENQNTYYLKSINIGNNVWITTNCVILPGSIIEDNIIITSGSIVKGHLFSNWIYGGNPIRKMKETGGIIPKIY